MRSFADLSGSAAVVRGWCGGTAWPGVLSLWRNATQKRMDQGRDLRVRGRGGGAGATGRPGTGRRQLCVIMAGGVLAGPRRARTPDGSDGPVR